MKSYLLLLLILISTTVAQQTSDSVQFSIKVGLGAHISSLGYAGGMVHFGFSAIYKVHTFAARYVNAEEFIFIGPEPAQYIQDFGILYGRQYSTNAFRFSSSAGLSIINGNKRGHNIQYRDPGLLGSHYDESIYYTVGIPAELCCSFIYLKDVELSANLIGNLNANNSYFGGSLCLGTGKLR